MRYRVALVGHCGFDSGGLTRAVEGALGDVEVLRINSQGELEAQRANLHLLLVNRQLDGRFAATGGVELMKALRQAGFDGPMLLVSNFEDAQASAEAAGASPGFGKHDLGSPVAKTRIRVAVGLEEGA